MITLEPGGAAGFYNLNFGLRGDDVSTAVELDLNSSPFNVEYKGTFPILTDIRVYDVNGLRVPDEPKSAVFKKGVLNVVFTNPVPRSSPMANGSNPPQRTLGVQFTYVVG